MKKARWTTAEDKIIIKSFREDWAWEELFKTLPKRTQAAIIQRSSSLKKDGKIPRSQTRWTSDEEEVIIAAAQTGRTAEDIHNDIPHRTVAAIASCLTKLRKQKRLGKSSKSKTRKSRQSTTAANQKTGEEPLAIGEGYELRGSPENRVLVLRSSTIRDPYDALKEANVDLDIWEIKDFIVNKWDMAAKKKDQESLMVTELWQVKVWLRL
ncbi:unnamed protein product, partial [marine sediment metagenome]